MTTEQFQHEVHDFKTTNREYAARIAQEYRERHAVNCVAVDFGEVGVGLMLREAAVSLGLPIVPDR